ncbi:MAG: N-acetylmuramoyl-L-alanine amidase [bacterium]
MRTASGCPSRTLLGILLLATTRYAASAQDWASLTNYSGSLTKMEFVRRLESVYCPSLALYDYITWGDNSVSVFSTTKKTAPALLELPFGTNAAPAPAFKTIDQLRSLHNPSNAPLRGLRICLDPGHIGGAWARMEERFLVVDRADWFVQEGALNLLVARLMKSRLEAAGATVLMTKDDFKPVTAARPDEFKEQAEREIGAYDKFPDLPDLFHEAARADAVRKRQELLFYRQAEISARARRVNEELKPDLTLCIHFNATEYSADKKLVVENGLMFFVHGNYLPDELRDDGQKFHLLRKLLEHAHDIELGAAESIATSMAAETGLRVIPLSDGGFVSSVGTNDLVYARNLAASRQYNGPVVFLEPYFMNNTTVYRRIQLGDYEGTLDVDGRQVPSIFREYADAVADGVIAFYTPLTTLEHSALNLTSGIHAQRGVASNRVFCLRGFAIDRM